MPAPSTSVSMKVKLLFLIAYLQLWGPMAQSIKCPIPSSSKYNGSSATNVGDVCACLDKERKITCRNRVYELASFELVPMYMDNLRRAFTYDKTHLSTFKLCMNVKYDAGQEMPHVRIGHELMSEWTFDNILIHRYCEPAHVKPISMDIKEDFLAMQTDTLRKLEIELPTGMQSTDGAVMLSLANALKHLKRLTSLVLWIEADLHLHLPAHMFARYSPFSYVVPLEDISITPPQLHEGELEELPNDNQLLSIGTHAFLNLKWLKLIMLRNVIVHRIDELAFAALFPVSHALTINFTNCNLQNTAFDKKAFLGLNREAIIFFSAASLSQPFIPQEDIFSEFLLENADNKIKLNYRIDCSNKNITLSVKWMLNPKYQLNEKRVQLLCFNGKNIFNYKFKAV